MDLDDYRAHHWYETLDLQIRLHGPERAVRAMVGGVFPRATANGVPSVEVEALVGQLADFSGWYRSWAKAAAARQELADKALRQGRTATARQAYVQASYLYFYGQLYARAEADKAEGSTHMVECYGQAARLLEPPAERVEIPHHGASMAAYLRLPSGRTRAPCLVMLGGADTVKEECHVWTEHFLERGVATLTLDGPGQGETHARLPMSADYEQAVSAARQWLRQRPEIEPERIGVWGCSTGGYLAARSMALDPRFKLGVSVGGFYDARMFRSWAPTTQEAFRRLYWLQSLSEAAAYVRDHVTLSGYMVKIERPFLIVHGAVDHLVSEDEIEQMAEEGGDRAELWAYENGTHAVWNRLHVAAPRTADWVAEGL